jgi:cysteinyl-tRNA synthetase
MDDNLDTPQALTSIHEMIGIANKAVDSGRADAAELKSALDLLAVFNKIFDVISAKPAELTEEELEFVEERERLRGARKYKEADIIRETLRKRNVVLEDTPYGVRPKRA